MPTGTTNRRCAWTSGLKTVPALATHNPPQLPTHNVMRLPLQLKKLDGDCEEFRARDTGKDPYLTHLRNNIKAPELLQVAAGAQVMLANPVI